MNKLNWEIAALAFVLAGCGGKTGKPVYQTDAIMSEPVVESATVDTVAAELETEENSQVIALVPNLASDKPLVMDEETKTEYLAPQWDPGDLWNQLRRKHWIGRTSSTSTARRSPGNSNLA